MCLASCSNGFWFVQCMAAFIPLIEFSDPGIAKKYGVKPDAETLDILNTVARQKEVVSICQFFSSLTVNRYQFSMFKGLVIVLQYSRLLFWWRSTGEMHAKRYVKQLIPFLWAVWSLGIEGMGGLRGWQVLLLLLTFCPKENLFMLRLNSRKMCLRQVPILLCHLWMISDALIFLL